MHGTQQPQPLKKGTAHPGEPRRFARLLYWRGLTLRQITDELAAFFPEHDVAYTTVATWRKRDGWDKAKSVDVVEEQLAAKIALYLDKEKFDEGDMKRVDFLTRQMERMARVRKYSAADGRESDLNPKLARPESDETKAKRAEKRKNFLTREQWEQLDEDFHKNLFGHQKTWWEQRHQRTRKLLKSRQIGATWYFAREALMKIGEAALDDEQARNQIFLSASKRQALKVRRYIVSWVKKVTGVDLKGDPIMLDLGEGMDQVGIYFLSTNAQTAQGEDGDFYFDEFFWVHGFAELKKVASAMATHTIYKRTYFSTPSTVTHEAHAFWCGDEWNKGKPKADQRKFDVSKRHLRDGAIMPDGSWCQIVTLDDAIAGGMGHLLDKDELRGECSDAEFANLYDCEFVDDSESSFPFAMINPARVDSFYAWRDFRPAERRPFGNKPVWIGYDPNKQGRDDAALVVLAAPETRGGKFRLLEKMRLNGLDFQGQADTIKKVCARYNVTDIGIDTSGAGQAVWELVRAFFPLARRIEYSVSAKAALVMKGQNVFRNRRFEYEMTWVDVASCLMAIRPTLTPGGKQVTYTSPRSGQHGHADVAWAILNALINEPMDGGATGSGRVAFFD